MAEGTRDRGRSAMTGELEPLDRKPYDVDPSWSAERAEAFVMYRDMGVDRNLRGVAQRLDKSLTLIGRWSSADQWPMRVAAWDADQDRIRQEAARKELERVTKKHARAIESTITVLMQPAMKLADMIENGDQRLLEDVDPITLANLTAQAGKQLPALVQASRLVHGVSTQNIEAKTDTRVRIEGASPDQLDAMLTSYDDGTTELLDTDTIEGTATDAEAPSSET